MAHRRSIITWPAVTAVIGVLALLIALPQEWKGWAPSFLSRQGLHLGLDLAGGTQLDFRISEEEINKQLEEVNAEIDRLGRAAHRLRISMSRRRRNRASRLSRAI